jgi:hypothetical protein
MWLRQHFVDKKEKKRYFYYGASRCRTVYVKLGPLLPNLPLKGSVRMEKDMASYVSWFCVHFQAIHLSL